MKNGEYFPGRYVFRAVRCGICSPRTGKIGRCRDYCELCFGDLCDTRGNHRLAKKQSNSSRVGENRLVEDCGEALPARAVECILTASRVRKMGMVNIFLA